MLSVDIGSLVVTESPGGTTKNRQSLKPQFRTPVLSAINANRSMTASYDAINNL